MNAYREPRPEEPPTPPRRWLPALLAIAAWTAGNFVPMPLPGVDAEAMRAYANEGTAGLFATPSTHLLVPLFGASVSTLVFVRGVVALFTHGGDEARQRRWYRRAAALFALCVGAQGFSTALFLEAARTTDYVNLVAHPGWTFRLGLAVLFAASGAAVWALASVVTRARVAHGPMALLTASIAIEYGRALFEGGRSVALGLGWLRPSLFVDVVPAIALLLALWRWSPRAWPQRFYRGVQALSPLDLLPIPFMVSSRVIWLASLRGAASTPAAVALALLAALVAAGLVARWLRRGGAYATSRPALGAALALPVVAAAVMLAGVGSGRTP